MASSGQFLCGCSPASKRGYSGDVVVGPLGTDVYVDKRHDDQGYEVCPEHGDRLYGWRSHGHVLPHYEDTGDGRPHTFVVPSGKPLKLKSSAPVLVDNRDPIEVRAAMLVEKNGHGGSHSAK